jgi:TP901 family phage tail tape measure protein
MAINLDVHGNTQPLEAAVQSAINRIRRQPIKISVDDKGATQPLGNMKRAADEFSKSMEAANARIIAFGASMAIINGVADAFKGMVKNMVEVEKALADINVVMGLSSKNLDDFSDGLFKVAKETGAAFKIAADAATEYARQGLNVEESLKRTKDALILTRLTGMDSAEAVKSLTAAMNTYGSQIKDTTQLVSKFAAVDVKFAVSAEDFADAIARTGAAAKGAGVDIDELIGLVTAAQQQTARGGKVIGNSFKTIFTRIGRTDTLNQLENLGIAVRDIEGKTLGAKKILTDLANTFDHLSEAQKAQIAQTVGGVFQINVLKAVLGDAAKQNGILANATQISAGATTEAIDKNEQLRQTMAAMATETGLAIKEVSAQIGEIMLAPGIEKVLSIVKSGVEGLSGLLGDGEDSGSKFANGFLKGMGNVISGPGLVIMTAVFGKLFLKAASFTRESLTSLIGVTSEAQKQKVIQSSLVGLFGRSSELSKEMLRTDISRTEKEKVILGLLKMQVSEAKALDSIAKSTASTLYSKGFGANLSPRRGRAYGHIPNFANPEREQAARGGYAAGSIRSMDMPGEGSVIYNSAEKVKTFSGLSQPAIMPPLSSKAGENYQQAFGSVHGFDPYAAKGFVPNFSRRSGAGIGSKKGQVNPLLSTVVKDIFDANSDITMLVPGGVKNPNASQNISKKAGRDSLSKKLVQKVLGANVPVTESVSSQLLGNTTAKWKVRGPKNLQGEAEDEYGGIHKDIFDSMVSSASKYMSRVLGTPTLLNSENVKKRLKDGGSGAKGAMGSAYGSIFEAALNEGLKLESSQDVLGSNFAGGDFDVHSVNKELSDLFGGIPGKRADYKASERQDPNYFSMAKKIASEYIFDGSALINSAKAREILRNHFTGRSYGHIPNFANPLSDAIGRERDAGIPVSQIRVGSHPALMNKGNPIGLGVTNTRDEPNGLKDVFGAKGYVPNYAIFKPGDFGSIEQEKANDLAKQANAHLKKRIDSYKQGNRTLDQLNKSAQKIASNYHLGSSAQQEVNQRLRKSISTIDRLNNARGRTTRSLGLRNANERFSKTTMGRALGSTGGQMGLMMGLPMAAGFLEDSIGGTTGKAIGGTLSGAGMGASMGMMFGPLGTAIGATVGAFSGLVSSINEARDAEKQRASEVGKQIAQALPAEFIGETMSQMSSSEMESMRKKLPKFEYGPNGRPLESYIYGDSSEVRTAHMRRDFRETSQGQGGIISKYLKDLEGKQLFKQIEGVGEDGIKFSEEKKAMTGAEYEKMLREQGVLDPKTENQQIALESLRVEMLNGMEAYNLEQEKINNENNKLKDGVILALNFQKAMLTAQQKAKMQQLEIQATYAKQSQTLKLEQKIIGSSITERQKASYKHTEAINKATEAYKGTAAQIDAQTKTGLLQKIKDSPSLSTAFKIHLGDENMKNQDLTNKVSSMGLKEILDAMDVLKGQEGQESIVTKILETELQKRIDNLEVAEKTRDSAKDLANAEQEVNLILAERKQSLADMQRINEMNSRALQSTQKIRGFDNQVAAAQRGLAVGPGYQTKQEREAFAIREKQFALEEKIKKLREDEQDQMAKLNASPEALEQERFLEYQKRFKGMKGKDAQIYKKGEGYVPDTYDNNFTNAEKEDYEALIKDEDERIKKLDEIDQKKKILNKETKKEVSASRTLLEIEKQRVAATRAHQTGPGAFGNAFKDAGKQMLEDAETLDYQLGTITANHFRDGLVGAMEAAMDRSKDLGDTLQGIAVGFLSAIRNALLTAMANQVVGAMGFNQGGSVRNYSKGGSVPAKVSNGEYLMNAGAVNKYGGSFMHQINAKGKIPGYSAGGSAPMHSQAQRMLGLNRRRETVNGRPVVSQGGLERVDTGKRYSKMPMSGFFYSQADNRQLEEGANMMGVVMEARQKRKQEAYEKKAKRHQLISSLISTAATFAISSAFNSGGARTGEAKAAGYGANTPKGTRMGVDSFGQNVSYAPGTDIGGYNSTPVRSWNPFSWFGDGNSLGGKIQKYASGGYISGKSGIDQIPAMLSEGEYVIKASSARQMGKPLLDQINAGKFYDGGEASPISDKSESSTSGGNTNNINISVNLSGGKESSGESMGGEDSQEKNDNSAERMKALSDQIKKQVMQVIAEEQRPGGLLEDTK